MSQFFMQIHEQIWDYSQVCRQANCCRFRTASIATIAVRALRGWDLARVYQRLVGGLGGTRTGSWQSRWTTL